MNDTSSRLLEEDPRAVAQRLMQKAQNRDGLPEIAAGLILLTFAGLYGLQVVFQPGSPIYKASGNAVLAMMMLLFIPFFGAQWAIKKLRMRFLIGKVGYVKLKPLNRKQLRRVISVAVAAAVVASVLAYILASRHSLPLSSWILAGNGIPGGLLAAVAGRSTRYYIGGGVLAATGIALALSGVSQNAGMTILYGFIGLFCLVSGSIRLSTLLQTPAEAGE
jgi:hypothetical protein